MICGVNEVWTEKLYSKMPVFLQNTMISLYGEKLRRQRYKDEYHSYKNWLYETEGLTLDEIRLINENSFLDFVKYVFENNDFYRNFYKGIDIQSFSSIQDIKKLPILEKETLRRNLNIIYMIEASQGICMHTGGTTGMPMEVLYQKRDIQRRMAMLDFYREKFGFKNGMRRATFSGRTIVPAKYSGKVFWRQNYALRQKLFSTFHLRNDNLKYYIEDLNDFQPEMIDGFPFAIHAIAYYIVRNGIKLAFSPLVVFVTSETLYAYQREVIEQAFDCRVANQYASAEGAPFVVECPHGFLHYDLRSGIIENEPGKGILVTSFTTYGTPLIRYAIGDEIEFPENDRMRKRCACGSINPIAKAIKGRSQDYVLSSERGMVGVGIVDIFKKIPPIVICSQIIQNKIDQIFLYLVIDGAELSDEYRAILIEEIKKRMGKKVEINIIITDHIEPEKNGKTRFIKNSLISGEEARKT